MNIFIYIIHKLASTIVTYLCQELNQGPSDQQPTELSLCPEKGKEMATQTVIFSSPKIGANFGLNLNVEEETYSTAMRITNTVSKL